VLIGHSLGGLIALAATLSDRPRADLLVLSAPAIEATISGPRKLLARVLGRVVGRLAIPNDITGEQLSADPAVGEAYFADPLVFTKTTTRLGSEFLAAMAPTRERAAAGIPVPTLVVHGESDSLVPAASSEMLGRLDGVDRIVFEGFRHESHNEGGGAVMLGVVGEWIDRHLQEIAPKD
jgi:alpha-beta hydrolase superfamily lysophospholipase